MLPAVPTKEERAISDAQVQANSTAIAMFERRLKMICAFRTVSSASSRRRPARTPAYVVGDHGRSTLLVRLNPKRNALGLDPGMIVRVGNDRGCASPNLVSEAASL